MPFQGRDTRNRRGLTLAPPAREPMHVDAIPDGGLPVVRVERVAYVFIHLSPDPNRGHAQLRHSRPKPRIVVEVIREGER